MQVGLSLGDFVLDGDPALPSPKKGAEPPPQFLVYVHCGQTAERIKMALGVEVGLGPGYIVLDWDPAALLKKGAEPPSQFSAHIYCGQTAGCIKMTLCMQVGLSPGKFFWTPPQF